MGDKMLRDIRNYILENDFKMIYLTDKLNIVNYEDILHFDTDKIIIRYNNGSVVIRGDDMIISKLLDSEILISGVIKCVEFK